MEYLFNPITMLTHFSLFPFSAVMSNSNTLQSVDGDLLNNNVEVIFTFFLHILHVFIFTNCCCVAIIISSYVILLVVIACEASVAVHVLVVLV